MSAPHITPLILPGNLALSSLYRDHRSYPRPYIKGLPVSLTVLSRQPNGDHSEEYIRPTYEDPYTLEYKALYDAIVNGTEIKNGPMDAKHDTELIHMIADALVPPPKA